MFSWLIHKNPFSRSKRLMVLMLAACCLSGCYEVDHEVISASQAVQLSGLPGTYNQGEGTSTFIAAVAGTNDYRYSQTSNGKTTGAGYFRAIPLRDDIYIVQFKADSEKYYNLAFYQFPGPGTAAFQAVSAKNMDDFKLAKKYHLAIGPPLSGDDADTGMSLSGKDKNIMGFLFAHKKAQFDRDLLEDF
jgi:hypothetical protein